MGFMYMPKVKRVKYSYQTDISLKVIRDWGRDSPICHICWSIRTVQDLPYWMHSSPGLHRTARAFLGHGLAPLGIFLLTVNIK